MIHYILFFSLFIFLSFLFLSFLSVLFYECHLSCSCSSVGSNSNAKYLKFKFKFCFLSYTIRQLGLGPDLGLAYRIRQKQKRVVLKSSISFIWVILPVPLLDPQVTGLLHSLQMTDWPHWSASLLRTCISYMELGDGMLMV